MMGDLHYLDPNPSGSPAVLLLHGLGANGLSWTFQFETLIRAGLRPIAPDAPGFGDSHYDGRGWNFRRVAAGLAMLLEGLNTGPVHVVGLSMGGVIAQQFALDYPHLVLKLVLVSSFAQLRPSSLSQWFYFVQRAIVVHTVGLATQSRIVAQRVFPAADQQTLREMAEQQITSAEPRAYRAAMRSLGLVNLQPRLKEINKPTLVISGANDSTVSPALQKKLTDCIPGARQIIIPGAGHAAAIDQFEVFNRDLNQFLLNC